MSISDIIIIYDKIKKRGIYMKKKFNLPFFIAIALFVAGLIRNDPPKYLNRSKFAVIIYLIQLAPDATKVTIIVIKYRSIETVVDTMPFLNIVDIAKAIITNSQTLINTQAK